MIKKYKANARVVITPTGYKELEAKDMEYWSYTLCHDIVEESTRHFIEGHFEVEIEYETVKYCSWCEKDASQSEVYWCCIDARVENAYTHGLIVCPHCLWTRPRIGACRCGCLCLDMYPYTHSFVAYITSHLNYQETNK